MTRLSQDPRLPYDGTMADFARAFTALFREYANQANAIAEGRMSAHYNASTSPPAMGTHHVGDLVRNSSPTVLGPAGSQWVVHGWQCVASGTPGTWVQLRHLTGT